MIVIQEGTNVTGLALGSVCAQPPPLGGGPWMTNCCPSLGRGWLPISAPQSLPWG